MLQRNRVLATHDRLLAIDKAHDRLANAIRRNASDDVLHVVRANKIVVRDMERGKLPEARLRGSTQRRRSAARTSRQQVELALVILDGHRGRGQWLAREKTQLSDAAVLVRDDVNRIGQRCRAKCRIVEDVKNGGHRLTLLRARESAD